MAVHRPLLLHRPFLEANSQGPPPMALPQLHLCLAPARNQIGGKIVNDVELNTPCKAPSVLTPPPPNTQSDPPPQRQVAAGRVLF